MTSIKYMIDLPKIVTDTYEKYFGRTEESVQLFNSLLEDNNIKEGSNSDSDIFIAGVMLCTLLNNNKIFSARDSVSFLKSIPNIDFEAVAAEKSMTADEMFYSIEDFLSISHE